MLTGAQLAVLADLAAAYGDGALELTSRANIQLRAFRGDPTELADRLAAAGLLPSLAHETVRNIAAPPLADAETRGLVEALDRALCGDDALAALPGRFLFAIGRTSLSADVAAVPVEGASPVDNGDTSSTEPPVVVDASGAAVPGQWAILLGGADVGVRAPGERVVETMVRAAHGFLAERAGREPRPWRLREIPDGAERIAARLPGPREKATPPDRGSSVAPEALVGVLGGSAVGALVPLGRLTGVHVTVLAPAERLAVTPGGGVVVLDLAPEAAYRWVQDLKEAGLVTERDSKWVGITTCAGRPGCAKALADVRADAERAARFVDGRPVHWVGCARGCGSPATPHVRVEATSDGYRVDGDPVDGDLGEVVAARRA
jgi:precorrin-3B synthase